MTSWIPNISLRRLSGSVFSGYRATADDESINDSSESTFDLKGVKEQTPGQLEAESTLNQFVERRKEALRQRRKEHEGRKEASGLCRSLGPNDGFSDVHDISPPNKKKDPTKHISDVTVEQDCDDVIQELELIHFLLTELNQRRNKVASVKELRSYLMMFYSNLITFIRNRDEPLNFRFSADKKSVEDKFDEKFIQVIDEYIKSNLFGLSNGKELFLTQNTITNYHVIEDKLCQGLDAGLKNKVLEMLNMANSCLTLHQILDGVKQNHQYLVSLRLKTVGSVRDFLVEHSRDFAVVDEMVCAVKDSKAGNYRIPQLQDVSDSAITKSKPCLKRSVSFADSKTITPVSSNTQPVANRAKAAFSKKIKVVEQRASSDHDGHPVRCAVFLAGSKGNGQKVRRQNSFESD